jgi:hypothetical protein
VVGCFLYPQSFAVPKADQAFLENGGFKDDDMHQRLVKTLNGFIQFAQKLQGKHE